MSDDYRTADERLLLDLFDSMDEHARYAMVKVGQFLAERPKELPFPSKSELDEFLEKARQESMARGSKSSDTLH